MQDVLLKNIFHIIEFNILYIYKKQIFPFDMEIEVRHQCNYIERITKYHKYENVQDGTIGLYSFLRTGSLLIM